MSPEHVEAMNLLLEEHQEVRTMCAALDRPWAMAYVLGDGPGGATVYWNCTVTDTFRFALEPNPEADVTFVGDWKQMIRATAANRIGEPVDPGLSIEGDQQALAVIAPIMETARAAVTVPVEFPDVG